MTALEQRLLTNLRNTPLSVNSHLNAYSNLVGNFATETKYWPSKVVFVSIPAAVARYIIGWLL